MEAKFTKDDKYIKCAKGHWFTNKTRKVKVSDAAAGEDLVKKVCQNCTDYNEMGPSLLESEAGWNCLPKTA